MPVAFSLVGLALAVLVGSRFDVTSGLAVAIAGVIFGLLAWAFQDPPPPADRADPGAVDFGK